MRTHIKMDKSNLQGYEHSKDRDGGHDEEDEAWHEEKRRGIYIIANNPVW